MAVLLSAAASESAFSTRCIVDLNRTLIAGIVNLISFPNKRPFLTGKSEHDLGYWPCSCLRLRPRALSPTGARPSRSAVTEQTNTGLTLQRSGGRFYPPNADCVTPRSVARGQTHVFRWGSNYANWTCHFSRVRFARKSEHLTGVQSKKNTG